MFASLIDGTCTLWVKNSCTRNQTCRLYDNPEFTSRFSYVLFSIRLLSAIFAFVTYIVMRKRGSFELSATQTNPIIKIEKTSINGITLLKTN